MPVPMDTDGTFTIKQLVEEAHQYEYSPTVPLKIYLTTADRLKTNANLFKEQDHYADAYRLYIRFLDLLTNKIATHPQLTKKNQKDYKKYLLLVKEASTIFQSAEEVKQVLNEKIEKYQRLSKKLAEQRAREAHERLVKAAEEAKGEQERNQAEEESQKDLCERRLSNDESAISDVSVQATELSVDQHSDSSKQLQGLRRKLSDDAQNLLRHPRTYSTSSLEQVESYPTIHKFHFQTHKITHREDQSSVPPIPPPKISSEPPSTINLQKTPPKSLVTPSSTTSLQSSPEYYQTSNLQPHKTSPPTTTIQHKPIAVNEAGKSLKKVFVPTELKSQFLDIAQSNTNKKLETCGVLCGKLSLNAFFVTTLLIPKQESTENTCQTVDEELMFEYIDKNDLFVLGWIHTHPTQTCFLSSVDLHTQNAYQLMLPEAVAIVCAPSVKPDVGPNGDFGVFRLTDPPGVSVITKCQRSGFHPHNEGNLYKSCERRNKGHVVFESGLPFTKEDLR